MLMMCSKEGAGSAALTTARKTSSFRPKARARWLPAGRTNMVPRYSRRDGNWPFARRKGRREWMRILAALHGLAFFIAVAVAPHSHANSLEDLLSDGPSDSGIFMEQTSASAPEPGVWFRAARLVDDDPCLACFQNDFQAATEPVSSILITPIFTLLAQTVVFPSSVEPTPPTEPPHSRAPPPIA